MLNKPIRDAAALFAIIMILSVHSKASGATKKDEEKKIPSGTNVMWRQPEDIRARDTFFGPGGRDMAPDGSDLILIRQETGGYSTKYRVRDAQGRIWIAKVGAEAQSETAAVRLLWAIGYTTEINYLLPHVRIAGVGEFDNVRLEARPADVKRVAEWKWRANPFQGSREFQGLKAMMMVFNNWDIKDSNNVLIFDRNSHELRYAISDLGATFGKTGSGPFWRMNRSRNMPSDYAESKFISKIRSGYLDFSNSGKEMSLFDDISIADAHWIANLLKQLDDNQVRAAFMAANYSPADTDLLMRGFRNRIRQLAEVQ